MPGFQSSNPNDPWWRNPDDIFGLSDPVYDVFFLPAIILGMGYLGVRAVIRAVSAKSESEA